MSSTNVPQYLNEKPRQMWADWTKGLCMFMVVLSHLNLTDSTHYNWVYSPVFLVCFFFVSGYFHKQQNTIGESLIRIFKKIIIPWFLLGVISMLRMAFAKSIMNGTWPVYLSTSFIRLIKGDTLWFLNCLVMTQVYYIVLMRLCSRFFANKLNLCILIIAIIGLCSIFVIAGRKPLVWSVDTALYALGWYALGNYIKTISTSKLELKWYFSALLVLLYLAVVIVVNKHIPIEYDMGNNIFTHPFLQVIISLLGCFVVYQLSLSIGRFWLKRDNAKAIMIKKLLFFELLGKHTLVTYCLHGSIGFFVVRFIFHITRVDVLAQYPYLYCLLFSYFTCWVMIGVSLLIERIAPFVVGKNVKK